MKDAGKITLLPRGEYDSSTQYEMLDMVTYEDNTYCAKKNSKGNTPSPTSSYWMFLGLSGSGGGDFEVTTLTQAEYNALSSADKNNGTVYFITDADGYGNTGGGGDMYKSIYDTDADGKVDKAKNADTVNNHTVLTNVPADAVFTDHTYSVMTGATSSSSGTSGLVPAPTSPTKFLRGDGSWQDINQSVTGFGTPTATINNSTGTPSVSVTATGDNSAKVFNFAFTNLKGEKGDKGDKGDTGNVDWATLTTAQKQELINAVATIVENDIASTDSMSF